MTLAPVQCIQYSNFLSATVATMVNVQYRIVSNRYNRMLTTLHFLKGTSRYRLDAVKTLPPNRVDDGQLKDSSRALHVTAKLVHA